MDCCSGIFLPAFAVHQPVAAYSYPSFRRVLRELAHGIKGMRAQSGVQPVESVT